MAGTPRSKYSWHHVFRVTLMVGGVSVLVAGCGQSSANPAHQITRKTFSLGSSGVKMILSYQPSPPVSLKTFHTKIGLLASDGKPVTDARVKMQLIMLEMNMPPQQVSLKYGGKGQYDGHSVFLMAGPWRMTTNVTINGHTTKESLTVHVGN